MKNRTFIDYYQVANRLYIQAQDVNNNQQKYNLLQTAITELDQLENKQDDHWRFLSKICKEIGIIFLANSQDKEAVIYYQSALQKFKNIEIKKDDDYRRICEICHCLMYAQLNLNHFDFACHIFIEGMINVHNIKLKTVMEQLIDEPFTHPKAYLEHFEIITGNDAYTNSSLYQQQKQTLLNYYEEYRLSEKFKMISPLINGSFFPRPQDAQDEDDMMEVDTEEYNPPLSPSSG